MIRLSRTDDLIRRRLIVVVVAVIFLLTSLGAYSLLVHGRAGPEVASHDSAPTSPPGPAYRLDEGRQTPSALPPTDDSEEFARLVAKALFNWDTSGNPRCAHRSPPGGRRPRRRRVARGWSRTSPTTCRPPRRGWSCATTQRSRRTASRDDGAHYPRRSTPRGRVGGRARRDRARRRVHRVHRLPPFLPCCYLLRLSRLDEPPSERGPRCERR
jgi:hypothetical protein